MNPIQPRQASSLRDGLIDSPANPRLRAAAALRDRRARDRTGRIVIDGGREIDRALDAGVAVESVFWCESLCQNETCRSVVRRALHAGIPVVPVSQRGFAKVAFGERAEGIVATAIRPATDLGRFQLRDAPLLVVVERIEKPGNLGAILRSADGVGADGLIAADPVSDLFNPNAIRASLGTVFTMQVAAATTEATLAWLRARALGIVVARVDGAALHTEANLRGSIAIVLGGEADGLTGAWSGPDVTSVRLPMLGSADSLNVSVAAAVLLYEARRQRDLPTRGSLTPGRTTRPSDDPAIRRGY